jgi:hypothetical protein
MADYTSTQGTASHNDVMTSDGKATIVRTDVLRQKLAAQPARVVVKVGNALEF